MAQWWSIEVLHGELSAFRWQEQHDDALIEAASRSRHERIVCEVNISPPNPAPDAFHAALGFTEIGQASIHGRTKTVRYLTRPLDR